MDCCSGWPAVQNHTCRNVAKWGVASSSFRNMARSYGSTFMKVDSTFFSLYKSSPTTSSMPSLDSTCMALEGGEWSWQVQYQDAR